MRKVRLVALLRRPDAQMHEVKPALPPGTHSVTRVVVPATPIAVRRVLIDLRQRWRADGMPDALCGTAEQVLAEALNNVVEHAHANRTNGRIDIETTLSESGLVFCIRDDGVPMPDGQLPAGELAELNGGLDDLPEGGFGWFVIRSLTRDLRYARQGGWNQLNFKIAGEG